MEEFLIGASVLIALILLLILVLLVAGIFGWLPTLIGVAVFVGMAYWIGVWLW